MPAFVICVLSGRNIGVMIKKIGGKMTEEKNKVCAVRVSLNTYETLKQKSNCNISRLLRQIISAHLKSHADLKRKEKENGKKRRSK